MLSTPSDPTNQLIIVLTMGRVSSMSLHASIPERVGRAKYHVHSVNIETLTRQILRKGSLANSARSVQEGVQAMKAVFDFPGRVAVISLVRDVIEREMSAAFASLMETKGAEDIQAVLSDPEATRRYYWKEFSHGRPFVWFDNEIKGVLGLDVYATSFPAHGWCKYSNARFDLLVMRRECAPSTKSRVVADFIGTEEFPIIVKNTQSADTATAAAYGRFKDNLHFTDAEREMYATSRYQRHFYAARA